MNLKTRFPAKTLAESGVSILDCEHKTPKFRDFGHPYIAIPNIRDGRIELSGASFISDDDLVEWTRRTEPQAGDLVITRRGRVGDSAPIPADIACAIGQNLVILRSNEEEVDQRYLRWAMRGPMHQAQVEKWLNVGAVFDSLNVRDLPRFEVPVPPLPEQRAIAHVLGTLDDKIELNRQMNQTLEQIAAALFKSWFVDFDPVRAKAAGRQPEGMDAETAALFPDRLVASELGEIPEGWTASKIDDLAQPARVSVNPSRNPEEHFSLYSLPAFDSGRMPIVESGASIKSNKLLIPDDAVLISKLNPHIPRIWLPFDSNGYRRLASTEFVVAQPLNQPHLPFLYALVSSDEFIQRMQGMVTGTTGSHQRVPPAAIMSMPLVMPAASLIDAYSGLMRPLYDRVHSNLAESRTLSELRDTLLPRLLSGELRVPTDVLDEEAVPMQTPPEPALTQSRF